MKRSFAIVLLCVHLFNLGGYMLAYQYFINRADVQMVKQLYSNNINDPSYIQLKIPVNMPTVDDWSDYEVVAGQVQLKDAYYNYVKLKMTRDTMYFICLPNKTKTQLVKANIIAAKEVSDVPLSKKGDTNAKKINSAGEYNLQAFNYQYTLTGATVTPTYCSGAPELIHPYIDSPGKPPNFIS